MHLLSDKELHDFEIAIQEPSINRHTEEMTTYTQALEGRFHVLLKPTPRDHEEERSRVCFFINKALDSKSRSIRYHTRDLSTLTLSASETIHIHNIYNPSPRRRVEGSLGALRRALDRGRNQSHIVVGDFNLHHPLWADPSYNHVHTEADELINIAADHGLSQLLPPGTITYEKRLENGTTHRTTASMVELVVNVFMSTFHPSGMAIQEII